MHMIRFSTNTPRLLMHQTAHIRTFRGRLPYQNDRGVHRPFYLGIKKVFLVPLRMISLKRFTGRGVLVVLELVLLEGKTV